MDMTMIVPLEVGLAVRDLARMRHFYETVLNCQFISEVSVLPEQANSSALCDCGYTVVRLQTSYGERIKLLAPVNLPPPDGKTSYILNKANATYLTFIVADIKAVMLRLQAEGVDLMTGPEPVLVRPGTYLIFFRDPEGHIIEIVQYADILNYRTDLHAGGV